jgi:phage shock protein A
MTDSITSRVGRIISGGLYQLADAVENAAPETVMEQAIREIESAIEDVRAELGKELATKHLASQRLADAETKHTDLSAKIAVAIQENREDLAETAIAQQLDLEAQRPVLERTLKECDEKERELESLISALQAKKREMKEELREFRQSRARASSPSAAAAQPTTVSIESRVAHAESAFDRLQERQTNLSGLRSDLRTASQLAELEELARKNRIQERLAAAKAAMKKT